VLPSRLILFDLTFSLVPGPLIPTFLIFKTKSNFIYKDGCCNIIQNRKNLGKKIPKVPEIGLLLNSIFDAHTLK
jgi:hypothetical protein